MVPKDFRDILESRGETVLKITNGLGAPHHLEVRSASSFMRFQQEVEGIMNEDEIEDFKLMYFGGAFTVEIDKAGRILVPATLRHLLGLTDAVAFTGVDSERFLIWRPDVLNSKYADVNARASAIRERLRQVRREAT
jgi:DNA-binding transcriptional regulator/RsmH inhibitor MraZ